MAKKGPLSKDEKKYITDNQHLPTEELAEQLDRSEASVKKFSDSLEQQEEAAPQAPTSGDLMARNKKYGVVTITESASMRADEYKKEPPKEDPTPARYRGVIHKIKGD